MKETVDLAIIIDNECSVGHFVVVQGRVALDKIVTAYEDHWNPQYSYLMLTTGQAIHIDLRYEDLIKMLG